MTEETAGSPAAAGRDPTIVRTSIVVNAPIEHTFAVFTERMRDWWPRQHHIGAAPLAAVVVEPRVGGRWYEIGTDGSDCQWGLVLAWDPPLHVAFSWHLDGDFRYEPDARRSSRVDVRFQRQGERATLVVLEHSGLDAHGPTWRRLRDNVSSSGGWPLIIARFRDDAEA